MGYAVEVEHVGGRGSVKGFRGILLHLNLLDSDGDRLAVLGCDAVVVVEDDAAVAGEGLCVGGVSNCNIECYISAEPTIVLGDLISSRLILVEVVLPVEAALPLDPAI